jgi:hypothetical protein
LQIAVTVRGRCTHEPLTVERAAALERELRASEADPDMARDASSRDALAGAALDEVEQAVVWGQYLDDYHWSQVQWGLYGTSSALQILATVAMRRGDAPDDEEEVAAALPLPTSRHTWDERLQKKVEKGDLNNIIKLAAVAEALALGVPNVPKGDEAPLVREIVKLSHKSHYWSSRPPGDRLRVNRDHEFPTAVVLYALRRYEFMREHKMWKKVRPWLAHTITTTPGLETSTLYALTGLALLPDKSEEGQVYEALRRIDEFLLEWSNGPERVVLSRPVFNGFTIEDGHDYLFLHPELLTALYFLERDVVAGRKYVLEIVDALCDNVTVHGAFEGQSRVVSTLDQLWAVRLLDKFMRVWEERGVDGVRPKWQLVPRRLRQRFRRRAMRLAIAVLLGVVTVVASAFIHDGGHVAWTSISAGIVALVCALVAIPILELLKTRDDEGM